MLAPLLLLVLSTQSHALIHAQLHYEASSYNLGAEEDTSQVDINDGLPVLVLHTEHKGVAGDACRRIITSNQALCFACVRGEARWFP